MNAVKLWLRRERLAVLYIHNEDGIGSDQGAQKQHWRQVNGLPTKGEGPGDNISRVGRSERMEGEFQRREELK